MPKPTVYLETSIIGYAASRPSRDIIVNARQQMTRKWLETAPTRFEVCVSQFVLRECSAGDTEAASERLALLAGLPLLATTKRAENIAEALIKLNAVPRTSAEDAYLIGVAAVHRVDYLATWNYKHIANAAIRRTIMRVCRDAGYETPTICTPEQLGADEDGPDYRTDPSIP